MRKLLGFPRVKNGHLPVIRFSKCSFFNSLYCDDFGLLDCKSQIHGCIRLFTHNNSILLYIKKLVARPEESSYYGCIVLRGINSMLNTHFSGSVYDPVLSVNLRALELGGDAQ